MKKKKINGWTINKMKMQLVTKVELQTDKWSE